MIRAIIFDYGGVFTTGKLKANAGLYASQKGKDAEQFKQFLINQWDHAKVNRISSDEFWRRCAQQLGVSKEAFEEDFKKLFSFQEEVFLLARTLSGRYKLGMISNNIEDWFEETKRRYALKDVFDAIVSSYEERIAKPHIKIYQIALQRLQVSAKECIFIDDERGNLGSAEQLGMKTIHFQNIEQCREELRSQGIEA